MLVRFGNEGYTSNKMIVQLQGVKKISSFRDRQNSAKKKTKIVQFFCKTLHLQNYFQIINNPEKKHNEADFSPNPPNHNL